MYFLNNIMILKYQKITFKEISEGFFERKKLQKIEMAQPSKDGAVVKEIVIGSVATPVPKPIKQVRTHNWTVYVRGVYNEDISYFVKKVVFVLHDSFPNPTRG